ncbi:hypothetical protein BS78_09G218300 [Paspalum vaginatum]|nr:hypothetical protein BS78_09G218300 [Paspalum vaginatum]
MESRSEEVIAGSNEVFKNSVVAADSADVLVADSIALDTVEEVSDVDEVVDCPHCSTFHAGGVFGEACYQARRNARRCARCGLLHEDYDIPARFLHDMDKFDCEFFIPDVDKLRMSGQTIILPEQVVKKLDEKMEKKLEKIKQAKSSP